MYAEVIHRIVSMHAEIFNRMPELGTRIRDQYCTRKVVEHSFINRRGQKVFNSSCIEYVKEIDTVGREIFPPESWIHIRPLSICFEELTGNTVNVRFSKGYIHLKFIYQRGQAIDWITVRATDNQQPRTSQLCENYPTDSY